MIRLKAMILGGVKDNQSYFNTESPACFAVASGYQLEVRSVIPWSFLRVFLEQNTQISGVTGADLCEL